MDFLKKPYFEYSLMDELIVIGFLIGAVVAFYGIKFLILLIKYYVNNRRK